MGKQNTRRDFLKNILRGTGIIAGMNLFPLLSGCEEKLPEKHISYHELFDGDVTITKTETTKRSMGDDWIQSIKLDMQINRPGYYLFEGWVANYRAKDSLGEKWEFNIEKAPYKEGRDLHSLIYRLEASRTGEEGNIERDTEEFKHHGIASSFAEQGKPLAR